MPRSTYLSPKQKRSIRKAVVAFCIFALLTVLAFTVYQWATQEKLRFVRYPEFGILMPEHYEIHGIDVSKYQQNIDWNEVRDMKVKEIKLGFSFIKATEGVINDDPQFARNWKKAKQANVPRGAYHFFIASKDATAQAQNFIKAVKLEQGDMPPVLDVEQLNGTSPDVLRQKCKTWLQLVEAQYNVRPIIYTNADFYEKYLGVEFDSYPLWVAHYYQQKEPRIKRDWIFWQHNDAGRVNGIVSAVDFNVFNGDSSDFKRMLMR